MDAIRYGYVNKPMEPASKSSRMSLSRRDWLHMTAWTGLGLAAMPCAVHAQLPTKASLRIRDATLAAIAHGVVGSRVGIVVDEATSGAVFVQPSNASERPIDVTPGLVLKGQGAGRTRFLDDPRNAPRVGAAFRDALGKWLPEHVAAFAANHKQSSQLLVRHVLRWQRALKNASVHGKKIRDDYNRVYLLEWGGAQVDAQGSPSPRALAKAPLSPTSPTMASYIAYIEALVQSLVGPQNP